MSDYTFGGCYAGVYDTLYQDKDYGAECEFLEQIFADYAPFFVHTVLDLGCGTGGHVLLLAGEDYIVTGVDRSEAMLTEARWKAAAQRVSCDFIQGDIRDLDLGCTYDVVIAMFAVVSYQTTNESLEDTFLTAQQHLKPGGLFIFDCWYGPAVLMQRPTNQCKAVESDGERIVRYTSPVLDVSQHTVRVDYEVLRMEGDLILERANESHLMRFLFPQEIKYYLNNTGFKLLRLCPFMDLEREPAEHDWNVTVIAEAV